MLTKVPGGGGNGPVEPEHSPPHGREIPDYVESGKEVSYRVAIVDRYLGVIATSRWNGRECRRARRHARRAVSPSPER